jgi:hypothetical protein
VLAGVGATIALAACAKTDPTAPTAGGPGASSPATLNLQPRFDVNQYAIPGTQRLVVSVLDNKGETPADLPRTLEFRASPGTATDGATVTADSHNDGVPVDFYPVTVKLDQTGRYNLSAVINGQTIGAPFNVAAADALQLVAVGTKMRALDTPTVDNARGVKPICTRQPGCPLHTMNLRDALATGKPIALLISTPAFCQIGVCGPVLDLLLEQQGAYPGVQFIHAEVYADPESQSQETTEAVNVYGLNYEPALFLARGDGIVAHRLDYVFDRPEIKAGLDLISR